MSELYNNIPAELTSRDQWVAWKFETRGADKPTKVPYNPLTGSRASNADAKDWVSFEEAKAASGYDGIGFVLTKDDPFVFIDLDDPTEIGDESVRAAETERLRAVLENAPDTYIERSPSGKGLHIIVKADALPAGRRQGKLEMYSSGRYMTMTGDRFSGSAIADGADFVNKIYDWLSGGRQRQESASGLLNATEDRMTDEDVIIRAKSMENGEKFSDLYAGNWPEYYNSQSEADQGFVNMLQFITKSPEQIARIFRASGLGEREKAQRDDYVKATIRKAFDQEIPMVDVSALNAQVEAHMRKKEEERVAKEAETPTFQVAPQSPSIPFPPGLVGDMAAYFMRSSIRPVAEVSLTAALGLMAGIAGRAYHINGSGLNLYLILLAPTGTGKEAINSGIGRLMSTVATVTNDKKMFNFVGPAAIASAPGLHTHIVEKSKSFVSVIGEMGLFMASMTGDKSSEHKKGLRMSLLDLYSKSDVGQVLNSAAYAKKEDSKAAVNHPAFSVIGESTPLRFYEALNEDLVAEGLMPRFTTIEYKGLRVPKNKGHYNVKPSDALVEALKNLCESVTYYNQNDIRVEVHLDSEAEAVMDAFDTECDEAINAGIVKARETGTSEEVLAHLWNRGHLKALRLAGVVAVGMPREPGEEPRVNKAVAEWAVNLIRSDILLMKRRFESGEIGEAAVGASENKQIEVMSKAIKGFIESGRNDAESMRSYGVTPAMVAGLTIPYTYFHRKLAKNKEFAKDRVGASNAIKRTLEVLSNRGELRPESKVVMAEKYDVSSLGYVIAKPFDFI